MKKLRKPTGPGKPAPVIEKPSQFDELMKQYDRLTEQAQRKIKQLQQDLNEVHELIAEYNIPLQELRRQTIYWAVATTLVTTLVVNMLRGGWEWLYLFPIWGCLSGCVVVFMSQYRRSSMINDRRDLYTKSTIIYNEMQFEFDILDELGKRRLEARRGRLEARRDLQSVASDVWNSQYARPSWTTNPRLGRLP